MITKLILAFIMGGFICMIAQILIDKTKLTPAKILVSLVGFGVFIGATGISVPLVGFGSAVAKGVREAVTEDGIFGILSGSFTAMGAGTALSLICGFLASVFVKGKSKKM